MIIYTTHARKRMEERKITDSHVNVVLAKPEIEYLSYGRTVVIKTIEGRKVGVVYVKEGNDIIVVTVTLGDEGP